ncbi:response regulator transcription factor [Leptothoe spongobia]|uniref:Response regulator n=1 Tax=Leptothoe spongobia TAU-MAC 1115 TaxID=1967444 RepID=A0A947DEM7_9CYAN|nr:response regulator [Leptothoe spongobia]MBT9314496.1 response regulator [Leptothoe spongobia TAU-MAC 1115]
MASILIIEDEPRTVSFLSQGLQQMGYRTFAVTNGERALPLALSKMFDLVLLDLMLPGLEGVSILSVIRAQRLQVPVIVMTALSSEKERSHAFLLGANEYIAKPFNFDYLLSHIRTYV